MGQKISPIGFRIGIIKDWDARWYSEKDYTNCFMRTYKFVTLLEKNYMALVSPALAASAANNFQINIHTAKPGMVIGKGGLAWNGSVAAWNKRQPKSAYQHHGN